MSSNSNENNINPTIIKDESKEIPKLIDDKLFWIQVRQTALDAINDGEPEVQLETFQQKIVRKCIQNPFVPLGALVTTYVLGKGIWNMRKRSPELTQAYMRGRVYAQGFTIMAMVLGAILLEGNFFKGKQHPKDDEDH